MNKVRVKFTETRIVDDNRKGTPEEEIYREGKSYNLLPEQARRWIRRGAAVPVKPAAPRKPKKDDVGEGGGNPPNPPGAQKST